jgi:hypothetical protein
LTERQLFFHTAWAQSGAEADGDSDMPESVKKITFAEMRAAGVRVC